MVSWTAGLTNREIADKLNLGVYMVQSILTEDLDISLVSAKVIPELLS